MTETPPPDENSRRGELERVLAILRRRAGLILLCLVLTAAAATGFSLLQEKQYSATASLLFRNPGFAEDLFGTAATAPSPDPVREAATNVRLVGLDAIAERTAQRLGGGFSAEEISSMVSAAAAGESDVVTVTATSPRPRQARRIANTFARSFIAFRAGTDRAKLLQAKRLAERELERLPAEERDGARGQALSRGVERLGILASLQTGNAELVQPAELPTSPSSPKPVRNGVLGAVLGLLLGIGLAFLLERLNRQLRDPDEAREAFGLPLLTAIPESKAIMASNDGTTAAELPFMENEAFRMLRSSLRYFNVDSEVHSVAVVSHSAGVGKSTVAWNLARVAATSAKAVLVETDLRNPSIAHQHRLASAPGLSALLTHQAELDDVTQTMAVAGGGGGDGSGEAGLDVIVAGVPPPNPAELIESQTMREVLSRLVERYDLVVIDTAPLGVVSDAFPLLREVDGAIAVARLGKTTRDGAARLREQLDRLEAPVLGVIPNGVKVRRGGRYGYGYYGGYGRGAAAETGDSATPAGVASEPGESR